MMKNKNDVILSGTNGLIKIIIFTLFYEYLMKNIGTYMYSERGAIELHFALDFMTIIDV